ncbi:amino acid permease-associated region [Spirochaeta thermophila DSM 6578]|uniref:Amino acid permease-associated region n=1 Tax=Winmispira thermophila (strain ATCC 700085 / DSM 6578 / Z-1203) TaxID=869211 RepID=G0GFN4_WINT7|nr:amino acid permease [Spirochaeta thermophila]AEJ62433.1 amino acid permease-associated region [Spirochaeta thermophila DSM 6578]
MSLKKGLSTLEVFSIATGAMISSGLFVLPSIIYREAGVGLSLSYLLAGFLLLPAVFSQLELSTAMPKAGGNYLAVERILGTAAGVVAGITNWLAISLKAGFALIGIGTFMTLLFPHLTEQEIKLIAMGACIFFTLLNIVSVESSGKAQVIMVGGLLAILAAYILLGYRAMDFSNFVKAPAGDIHRILGAAGTVVISYGGITKVASIAEEVKDPGKNLVRGIMLSFWVTIAFYALAVLVTQGLLSHEELTSTYTPISTAAGKLVGPVGVWLTGLATLLAFITTANAGIMTASRNPLSMARDGLLPSFFGRVSGKTGTPIPSILTTSAVILAVVAGLSIENFAKVASLFMLFTYILTNLSVIVMRYAGLVNYRPTFKSPFFPVLHITSIVVYAILIVDMGVLTIAIAGGIILLSLLWYLVYARTQSRRRSAFLHMVARLTNKEIAGDDLEEELLSILLERHDIVEDEFDRLIREAWILDMDRPATQDEVFEILAQAIAERIDIPVETAREKLLTREQEASTIIFPGIAVPHAIPHIVVEGEGTFAVFIVRNVHGITWNDQTVYTAFCLAGSKDKRDLHLRALMAIAQIVQTRIFTEEWLKARNPQELKTILLLAERKRT